MRVLHLSARSETTLDVVPVVLVGAQWPSGQQNKPPAIAALAVESRVSQLSVRLFPLLVLVLEVWVVVAL